MLKVYWTQLMSFDARGYGKVAQELGWALETAGVRMLAPTEFNWDFKVLVSTPKSWYHPDPVTVHEDVIYHTMYDADLLPEPWIDCLNLVGNIWVPSEWSKNVFIRSGVTQPIFVSGYGVDHERMVYTPPPMFTGCPDSLVHSHEDLNKGELEIRAPKEWLQKNLGLNIYEGLIDASSEVIQSAPKDKPFVFLSVATNVFDRKGAMTAIRAFRGLDAPNAILVLKFNSGMSVVVKDDDRIRSLVGDYSTEDFINLIQRCNCLVYPSSGEGFGLIPLEGMALGRPVIVTDYAGMTEYVDEKYCYPLPIEGIQRSELYNQAYDADGSWAMISEDTLCGIMQHVYDNYEEAVEKGRLASDHVRSVWTWDSAGERALAALEDLYWRI
ncbi:glycosyltransferase [Patescibacteria group bacterium]|nr:glycosyltransferase [Patescibacteria group bacterium]